MGQVRFFRARRALATSAVLLALGATAEAQQQQQATWLGGSGNWSDPAKWSGGAVPNNNGATTFNVAIDAGNPSSSTTVIGFISGPASYRVDSLALDAGDTLSFNALDAWWPQLEVLGGANVNGTVSFQSFGTLLLGSNGVLSGSGTISGIGSTGVLSATSGGTTIGPGMVVRGRMTVGLSSAPLINYGTLRTDAGDLTVNGTSIDNHGTLICNGGDLTVNSGFRLDSIGTLLNTAGRVWIGGTLDNTVEVFRVDNAHGDWGLRGTLRGGTYESGDGRALIVRANSTSTLDSVIVNGLISMNSTGTLLIPAGQSLTGSGTVQLGSNTPPASISTVTCPTATLTVDSGMTVRGQGLVMGGTANSLEPVVNRGHIVADVPNGLLEIRGAKVLNVGSMETANGGILGLGGTFTLDELGEIHNNNGKLRITGTLENTGRTFAVTTANTWELAGTVHGGTIDVQSGPLLVPRFYKATLDGTFVKGAIQVGDNYPATLTIPANRALMGNGTIDLSSNFNGLYSDDGVSTLTIGAGITVRGSANARIGDGNGPIVNEGVIRSVLNRYQLILGATHLYNRGQIIVEPNADLTLNGSIYPQDLGQITNSGRIRIDATVQNSGLTFQPLVTVPGYWYLGDGSFVGGTLKSPPNDDRFLLGGRSMGLDGVTLGGTFTLGGGLSVNGGLTGNAQIYMSDAYGTITSNSTLRIGSGISIYSGAINDNWMSVIGRAGSSYVSQLDNAGTITAMTFGFYPRALEMSGRGITNTGMLQALSSATFTVVANELHNAGAITLDPDARFHVQKNVAASLLANVSVDDGGIFDFRVGAATDTGTGGLSGVLEIDGALNLSSLDDHLIIEPVSGFDLTRTYTLLTYGGTLSGQFDHVTDGFFVDYSIPGRINVRFAPEPVGTVLLALGCYAATSRRRR